MKYLIIIAVIAASLASYSAMAECILSAQTKTAKSKAIYIANTSISKKVRAALESSGVEFNTSVMSKADLLAFEKAAYEAKLAKINK